MLLATNANHRPTSPTRPLGAFVNSTASACFDVDQMLSDSPPPLMKTASTSSSPLLDFNLINPNSNKSIMNLFGAAVMPLQSLERLQHQNAEFTHEAETTTTESAATDVNNGVAECDFCKKIGSKSEFKGRFCSKICVGRFAQRTRLMRKHNERSLAATAAVSPNDSNAQLSKISPSSPLSPPPLPLPPLLKSPLFDATNESFTPSSPIMRSPPDTEKTNSALKEDQHGPYYFESEKLTESDDMEIEIFKPTINYSNISDEYHNQAKNGRTITSSPKPVNLDIGSSSSERDRSKQIFANDQTNLLSRRSYALRKKERKNSFLERLQSKYDIKQEVVVAASAVAAKPKRQQLTNVSSAAAAAQRTTTPIVTKLKRGRPSKKAAITPTAAAAAAAVTSSTTTPPKTQAAVRMSAKRARYWLKMKENIRESVFLTKVYTKNDLFKTVGFKIDSKLAIGEIDRFMSQRASGTTRCLKFWSVDEVSKFVASIPGCEKFVKLFVTQEIDGEALILIKLDDLIRLMQIQLGPALKIFNYIAKLKYLTNSTMV